jgi:hypothetical protein
MAYQSNKSRFTRFEELLTAKRISQLNLKPTWGISSLRYSNTAILGATNEEFNGEFRLQSGTANNGLATIATNQRAQYKAGSMGQCGIGVRIPVPPLSTAFCEWGYTDFNNGFYFGVDGGGKYVAIVTHIDFTWYGYGDIEFSYFIKNPNTLEIERKVCHRIKIDGTASIIDPNQPLSFRSGNGASTTANVVLYIGGHQFSSVDGELSSQNRIGSDLITSYVTVANILWQPIIAIKKKLTFNGRPNSVNVQLSDFLVAATGGDLEVRITIGGTTSNLTFGTPTGRTATETAIETKRTGVTALTTSASGEPTQYSYVLAGGSGTNVKGASESEAQFVLGQNTEIILWVKRMSASGVITVNHAHITWTESW